MPLTKKRKEELSEMAQDAADDLIAKRLEEAAPAKPAKPIRKQRRTFDFPKGDDGPNVIVKQEGAEEFRLLRVLKAHVYGDREIAAYEFEVMAEVRKTLQSGAVTAGGYFVPTDRADGYIDLLSPNAAFRQLNPMIVPMKSSQLTIPKVTGGVEAEYEGENETATESTPSTGLVQLNAKKLISLVPVSNDWIEDADAGSEGLVRSLMARKMAEKETVSFIRGPGLKTPRGLINMPDVAVQSAIAEASLVYDTVINLEGFVEDADSMVTKWLTTPKVMRILRLEKDDEGRPIIQRVYTGEDKTETLLGIPVVTSTLIRNAAKTVDYLCGGNWPDEFAIGERKVIEFAISTELGFKQDITYVRAIQRHDCVARHEEAFAVQPVTLTV